MSRYPASPQPAVDVDRRAGAGRRDRAPPPSARIGVRWLLASDLSPSLSVHVPFPDTGLVIAPSIGYQIGF